MKHLLLVEHESNLDSFISEYPKVQDRFCVFACKFDEFESLACSEKFDGGVIVLVPTWRELKLEALREKFPGKKVMLLSAMISDVTVKELQHDKNVIDLFFKAPVVMEKIDAMYEAFTSAQTASVSIGVDDEDGGLQLDGQDDDETIGLDMPSDDGGLELDGVSEDEASLEMNSNEVPSLESSAIDLGKELEGIEGGILGVDNVSAQEETKGKDLMNLLDGNGEEDKSSQYDSHDISRILKTEDLMGELNKEKKAQSEKSKPFVQEFANPSLLEGEDLSPEPTPEPSLGSPEVEAPVKSGVDMDEVQKILRHREEDYLKLLSRNEVLEEENRIIREKIISLEEVASSASLISKRKSLESDESRIKISVLKRHHTEELEKLHSQNRFYKEQLGVFKENLERLTEENKKLLKQNMLDVKKIRSREEELEEKIQLMKADVSSQIKNRENKIIELKRKIDLLHFDLKDSEEREKELTEKISVLEEKLYKLKKVLGESIERLDDSFYGQPVKKVKL